MDTGLAEQGVLVTGGAGGIGTAVSRAFAAEGARVAVHYRTSEAPAQALASETLQRLLEVGGDRLGVALPAVRCGLFRESPTAVLGNEDGLVDQLMQLLIGIRTAARENKDFATADRVRDELAAIGIVLEDRKGETGWRRE